MTFVQELCKKKQYKADTMHYACHLVDRYLAYVIREKLYDDTPNLYHLAAVSCLIAAKLEEPVSPSFNRLMAIIPSIERRRMSK